MSPLEIEVKFFIADYIALRQQILDRGAQSRGCFFETNTRYENEKNSLADRRCLLRLRKDQRTTLTVKAEAPDPDNQFKIHREWEVQVSDFATMDTILTTLGFHAEQVYEKRRETFLLEGTTLCLDEMPFGHFIEIEGAKTAIMIVAEMLNLDWHDRILHHYLALFDIIKSRFGLDFNDITFDNFSGISVDLPALLPLFRGG